MIISFSLENWMSFRDKVTFSMVASRERQHGARVPRVKKYHTRVLPLTAIYGGNASGKSNFFKALDFAKDMVVEGTPLSPKNEIRGVEPFRLNAKSVTSPSRFEFVLLIDETIYEFHFALDLKEVHEEKLMKSTGTSEELLYHRQDGGIKFGKSFNDETRKQRLNFVFEGTRDNQLFLTNAISQNVDDLRPVYNWFKDTLRLVAPNASFEALGRFLEQMSSRHSKMNDILDSLDTGIARLDFERIASDDMPLLEPIKSEFQKLVPEGKTFPLSGAEQRFEVTRRDGELIAKKLVAYHQRDDGAKVKFGFGQESDGSQRIVELLPAFFDLSRQSSTKVYVIDELDRSLHTMLVRELLNGYLGNCTAETRSQLLLTTHDVMLMDQQLLRRDEMWVAERAADGSSCLIPFSDYKDIRYDKDIRKTYLLGQLGGTPRMWLTPSDLSEAFEEHAASEEKN